MSKVESVSDVVCSCPIDMEFTLALIKPDLYVRAADIEEIILSHNFIVSQRRVVKLSREDASEFYAEQCGTMSFAGLVTFLSSGPLLVLLLTHPGGPGVTLDQFKKLVGPTNSNKAREISPDRCLKDLERAAKNHYNVTDFRIQSDDCIHTSRFQELGGSSPRTQNFHLLFRLRALFGMDELRNAVHASESLTAAKREIKFFFPSVTMDPLRLQNKANEYLDRFVTPTLLQGLDALCKCKPQNPVAWLADWLLNNNPNKPSILHPD